MLERVLKIKGMSCHSCGTLLSEAALGVKGVSAAEADAKKGVLRVEVSTESAVKAVAEAVRENGYSVEWVE
ncbi:MAG: cation transporter [Candidatus Micrarchaeota archaeon]